MSLKDELTELSHNDPVVAAAMNHYYAGHASFEDALILAIKTLSQQKNSLIKDMAKLSSKLTFYTL